MTPAQPHPDAFPLLFFDGECGLCRRCVWLLLRLDRGGRLRFAPLQGGMAEGYLRTHHLPPHDPETLVFVPDWSRRAEPGFLLRTDGLAAALRATGGMGRLLAWFALIPVGWRDAGYRIVARWRRKIFSGGNVPLPADDPAWADRFPGGGRAKGAPSNGRRPSPKS